MKRLTDYFFEEAYGAENPVPGDCFDIEVNTDTIIETVVTELTEDGDVIVSLDEAAMSMLQQQGILFESSDMPSAVDSTSAIHGGPRQKIEPTDGVMSPINGNAFLPYDRKKDPRTWFTDIKNKIKQHDEHEDSSHLHEAEYHGRSVPLGKPMAGDVKKSKVYVRKPNGNIVKVNFGDKTMKIKKSNPKRRKSFRARHNCANPGPRWKARYWSCRAW
jgi:hypothetical protein